MGAGRPLSTEVSKELGFSFNTRLANNLRYWRNAVLHQDTDCTVLIDGKEGGGKSVLAMQVAYYMDVDHEIDIERQICYYPEQFKKAVGVLKKGKAIVWDEARRGLNRRRGLTEKNLSILDMIAECRQHNLFLVIVMPSFYDMDMYVAVWRSRVLIHIWYTMDATDIQRPLRRGYFRFYSEEGKKQLYTNKLLRQKYDYPYLKNLCFDGTFPNHYVVDEQDYRDRKMKAEEFFTKGSEPGLDPVEVQRIQRDAIFVLLNILRRNLLLKHSAITTISRILGFSYASVMQGMKDAPDTIKPLNTRSKALISKSVVVHGSTYITPGREEPLDLDDDDPNDTTGSVSGTDETLAEGEE